ncbi:MAG: CxC ATPase DNA modification system associated small protein [Candidatus Promineifilaceae bacterium]
MKLDDKIVEAINTEVARSGQPSALARKLTAWLSAVVSGNDDLNNDQSTRSRLELIFNDIDVKKQEELF